MTIHKQDFFKMSREQQAAGKRMWQRTGQQGGRLDGRLMSSSFDAEATAPKTWLFYVNSKNELISNPIECELYVVGRHTDSGDAVAMLHGMCPKCGETFIAREDNKTMTVDRVPYRQAPRRFREQWARHCSESLGRHPRGEDQIAIVSSPERWACDYCRSWCVKVEGGIAVDNHRGVAQIVVPVGAQLTPPAAPTKGVAEF
jgi:ribosomal protein S27AE